MPVGAEHGPVDADGRRVRGAQAAQGVWLVDDDELVAVDHGDPIEFVPVGAYGVAVGVHLREHG